MAGGRGNGVFDGIAVGGTGEAVAVLVGVDDGVLDGTSVAVGLAVSIAADKGSGVAVSIAISTAVAIGGTGVNVRTTITIKLDFGASEDCDEFFPIPTRAMTSVVSNKAASTSRIIINGRSLRLFFGMGATGLVLSLKNEGASPLRCDFAHTKPF